MLLWGIVSIQVMWSVELLLLWEIVSLQVMWSHTSLVIMPTTAGDINPVTAAIELEIPNNIPAYWGAISTWLIRKPLYWNPVRLTAKVNSTIANAGVVQSTYPSPINIKAGTILPVKINLQLISRLELFYLKNKSTINIKVKTFWHSKCQFFKK